MYVNEVNGLPLYINTGNINAGNIDFYIENI